MSNFDPEAFLGTDTSENMETRIIPVPADDHLAIVDKVAARAVTVKDEEKVMMDITWKLEDADGKVAEETGREVNTVRQSIWLDINDNGSIATGPGKNVQLGRLREALGQNKAGKAWNPNMLLGQPAIISVTQRADKDDPETIYNDVKKVVAV